MNILCRYIAVVTLPVSVLVIAATGQSVTQFHVTSRRPVQGPSIEVGAERTTRSANTVRATSKPRPMTANSNAWQVVATLPGALVHDLSFATPSIGFAAAELGQVWKTSDGGATWTAVMNLGIPYYWYGIHALDSNNVVVSGFTNTSSGSNGIIRWTHDGGATWSGDLMLSSQSTIQGKRVRFSDSLHGLVFDNSNTVQYTVDGGSALTDWTSVTIGPWGQWFGDQFSLLPDQRADASGIKYCTSLDSGQTWACHASVDSVFDGPVFFVDDNNGWVGGGEISPAVEGWIHRTTDGGTTWSGRVLDGPWPIREILFLSPTMGWAAGGNVYSSVGGAYFSIDGGQNWSLDFDSNGQEINGCDAQPSGNAYKVWCIGYNTACTSFGNPVCQGSVFQLQGAASPDFTPLPQSYSTTQSVTISDSAPNATIYYTTDGSTPNTTSTVYTGPITVSASETINAIATSSGFGPSLLATGSYAITPALQFQGGSSTLVVSAGGSGTVQLSLSGTASISNVTFACSGLPTGAQCLFSPSSVNVGTSATNVSLTISAASLSRRTLASTATTMVGAMVLGFVLLPGGFFQSRRKRRWLIVVLFTVGLGGCGGSGSNSGGSQPIQATVTVTASAANATSGTTTVHLTIN